MKVYLAGPINGCTDDQAQTWRDIVKAQLGEEHCIDPMRRDYRGREDDSWREIVDLDLIDLLYADIVLVNAWTPSVGTSMECWHASQNMLLPVIVIAPLGGRVSPWWRYVAERIVHSLDDGIAAVLEVAASQ